MLIVEFDSGPFVLLIFAPIFSLLDWGDLHGRVGCVAYIYNIIIIIATFYIL